MSLVPIHNQNELLQQVAAGNESAFRTLFYAWRQKLGSYSAQKGEALVARAYSHFMLVCLFAKMYDPATASSDMGIPYVTEPEDVVIKLYDTVQYVYDIIDNDLSEGIPLINERTYEVPKYHFTKQAAYAFAVLRM